MAVPPVATRPPVKRDEPTPTAVTPTSAVVPPAPVATPVTAVPTTSPVQAIYLCSAPCVQDGEREFARTYGSSTKDVADAQELVRHACLQRYSNYAYYAGNLLNFQCEVHAVPSAVRICQEPVKSEVPARGEKPQN